MKEERVDLRISHPEDLEAAGQQTQLISNNHDSYERQVLLCKPVCITKGARIGAGQPSCPV